VGQAVNCSRAHGRT